MGIFYEHLRDCVIVPTLKESGLHSDAAVNLLIGTAAHESLGGHYLKQRGGPARGIYQMEPATMQDLFDNWMKSKGQYGSMKPDPERLQWDLKYATLWARLYYLRSPDPLPAADDLRGLANYWYKNWCKGCKGTVSQWMADYQRYVMTL